MIDRSRRLCTMLGIEHPIIQAPMGGGAGTVDLITAVAEAGGLGSLGAAYLTPDQIRQDMAEIRRGTNKPFNVNLFAGGYANDQGAVDPTAMLEILGRHHGALGLPEPRLINPPKNPFAAQFEALMEAPPAVFSFTFGIPEAAAMARLKACGCRIIGTATTVEEARLLAAAGVDAIVAQGSEAGAHRGTFAAPFDAAMIGTMALVPQIVDAVGGDVPIIASGGIMDGRGIVAARALGAAGVQLGTAFLTTDEAGVPEAYKAALMRAQEDKAAITRAFSGRPARGLVNAFIAEVEAAEANRPVIPPFPLQNALTRTMRAAAAAAGDADRLSLWAGQGVGLARRLPAAELLRRLVAEQDKILSELDKSNTG
ncbi:MAG TPA: nitronate monooxygenase [Stellaceae bacterium]|nr:nitronate monooxygenase [Stellaceae bacterium]